MEIHTPLAVIDWNFLHSMRNSVYYIFSHLSPTDPLPGAEGEGAAPRTHAHEAQGLRHRRPAAQALRKYREVLGGTLLSVR